MSLQRLRFSLERLIPRDNTDSTRLTDLESLLLTSRQCSEKYHRLIPEILNTGNPDEPADFEQNMMWFAFKNDRPPDESIFGNNEEEKEERWKKDWLDRMERRELVLFSLSPRIPPRGADDLRGFRFRSSYICFGCATPHPIPPLSLPRARPLLPRNGSSAIGQRPVLLRINSSL